MSLKAKLSNTTIQIPSRKCRVEYHNLHHRDQIHDCNNDLSRIQNVWPLKKRMLYTAFSVPLFAGGGTHIFFGTTVFSNCTLLTSLGGQAQRGTWSLQEKSASCLSNTHEFGKNVALHPGEIPKVQLCWSYLWEGWAEMHVTLLPKDSDLDITIFFLIFVALYLRMSRNFQLLRKHLIATRRAGEMQNRTAQWQYKRMSCHLQWRSSALSCSSRWTFRVSF